MELRKISLRRPRSVDDTELGYLTLLFCRGRVRIDLKIYNARAQLLFCLLKFLFGDVLVAVLVVFAWAPQCFCHSHIKFISSRHCVISSMFYWKLIFETDWVVYFRHLNGVCGGIAWFLNFETGFLKVNLILEAECFRRFDCKQGRI